MKLILLALAFTLVVAEPQDLAPKVAGAPPQPLPHPPFPPGQYYPGQHYPGQHYPGQHYPGQHYPGQYYPGQYYSGQQYPGYHPGQYYQGQYNKGPFDPYYGGAFRPYDQYHRGQFDPKLIPGAKYDPKLYQAQFGKYFEQYQHHVPILEQSSQSNPDGSFKYSYASADGTQAEAEGFAKPSDFDPSDVSNSIRGSYSYQAPDGTPVAYSYIADEHGFRVEGTHVPKVPEAIQRSLEYNEHYKQYPRGPFAKALAPEALPVPGAPAPPQN